MCPNEEITLAIDELDPDASSCSDNFDFGIQEKVDIEKNENFRFFKKHNSKMCLCHFLMYDNA